MWSGKGLVCRFGGTVVADGPRLPGTSHPLNVELGSRRPEAPAGPNRKRVERAVELRCWRRSARITAAIPVDGTAGIVVKRDAPPLCTGMHAAAGIPGRGGAPPAREIGRDQM